MKALWTTIYFFTCALTAFQPVDLNRASDEQIALLPSVGKRLAQNIVAERKHRSFASISDLAPIAGMTERKLAQIKNYVVFGSRIKKLSSTKGEIVELSLPLSTKPIIDIAELEEKVLSWQGLDREADRALSSRVRLSAWLPQVSTYIDTDHGEIATKKGLGDQIHTRGGRDVGFGIKAQFDFDKLVFNQNEIDVAKLMLARQERRNELLAQMRKLYFRYLELASMRVSDKDPEDHKNKLKLELAEIKASLDILSGNAFSHHDDVAIFREKS
jgi:hypothetical protein